MQQKMVNFLLLIYVNFTLPIEYIQYENVRTADIQHLKISGTARTAVTCLPDDFFRTSVGNLKFRLNNRIDFYRASQVELLNSGCISFSYIRTDFHLFYQLLKGKRKQSAAFYT